MTTAYKNINLRSNTTIIISIVILVVLLILLTISVLLTLLVVVIVLLVLLLLKVRSPMLSLLLLVLVSFNISIKILSLTTNSNTTNTNTTELLKKLIFKPKYPMYSNSIIPTWIVTKSNASSSIRFFDSSPFSPSNRYIAITRVSTKQENKEIIAGDTASIVVIDLLLGIEMLIDTTNGWDSQLGAQIQWGLTDYELIYNTHIKSKTNAVGIYSNSMNGGVGVITNIFTKETRYLQCGIYHVRYITLTTTNTTTTNTTTTTTTNTTTTTTNSTTTTNTNTNTNTNTIVLMVSMEYRLI